MSKGPKTQDLKTPKLAHTPATVLCHPTPIFAQVARDEAPPRLNTQQAQSLASPKPHGRYAA